MIKNKKMEKKKTLKVNIYELLNILNILNIIY